MVMDKKLIKYKGKLVVVTSAKGGTGKSVLATNLAVALSASTRNVAILDTSFQFSDLHIMLEKKYKYNVNDVIDRLSEIDYETVGLYLTQYNKKNLLVLPGPKTPEQGEQIDEEKYLKLVNLLLEKKDYVVIDMHNSFSDININLLDRADYIYLVGNSEMNSVISTKKYIEILEQMKLQNITNVIINKYQKNGNLNKNEIGKMLDAYKVVYIPRANRLIEKSIGIGVPATLLHKSSSFSKKVLYIANQIVSTSNGGE